MPEEKCGLEHESLAPALDGYIAIPTDRFDTARSAFFQLSSQMVVGPNDAFHYKLTPNLMQAFKELFTPTRDL